MHANFKLRSDLCLCRYEETDEGVTVRFRRQVGGEETEEVQVQTKLVVGADGAHSAVRRACLDDGPPQSGVRDPPGLEPLCVHALSPSLPCSPVHQHASRRNKRKTWGPAACNKLMLQLVLVLLC